MRVSSAPSRGSRLAHRAGLTLVEIMIVVAVAGILMAVAIPRFAEFNNRRQIRSAKLRLATALATARQGAIQRGMPMRFHVHSSRIRVTRGTTSTVVGLVAPVDSLYKVNITVSPSWADHFDFDSRGFAQGLGGRVKYRLTRPGAPADSICISRMGMIQRACDLP
jgi:prepilin-type N-terminal cleavage/methylation domain-containing protein